MVLEIFSNLYDSMTDEKAEPEQTVLLDIADEYDES